jgi:endonuclease III
MGREKVEACIAILENLYGEPSVEEIDPVDLLIMTILSQNTSDVNSLRAFRLLKSAYPEKGDLLKVSEEDIADKIRLGGLAEIKAHRIREAILRINRDAGAIDLGFLAKLDREKAAGYLLSLPGVGPKTASVVLLFAFRMPTMPVDTHVYRVSRRLGLVPEESNLQETQRTLEEITPPEKYLSLHLNLIRHGRTICRARGARHDHCRMRHLCDCYVRGTNLK